MQPYRDRCFSSELSSSGCSPPEDNAASQAKPTLVLMLLLVLLGILCTVAGIGLLMTFVGAVGFLISVTGAILGSSVPEQVRVISWSVAAVGMTVSAGAMIAGFMAVLASVFVTVLRSTLRGN